MLRVRSLIKAHGLGNVLNIFACKWFIVYLKWEVIPFQHCIWNYSIFYFRQKSTRRAVRTKKLNITIIAIGLGHLICTLPYVIYQLYYELIGVHRPILHTFVLALYFLQFALNFCIYMALRDQYRKAYKRYMMEVIFRPLTYKF